MSPKQFFTHPAFNWVFGLFGMILMGGLVFSPYLPNPVSYQLGTPAGRTVFSPRTVDVETASDALRTSLLITQKTAEFTPIYVQDEAVSAQVMDSVSTIFTDFREYLRAGRTRNVNFNRIPRSLQFFNSRDLRTYRSFSNSDIRVLEYSVYQSIRLLLAKGILEIDPKVLKADIEKTLEPLKLSQVRRQFIMDVVSHAIRPNMVVDFEKTSAHQAREIDSIPRFKTTVIKGRPVVFEGEIVTQDHIDILNELGLISRVINIKKLGAFILIVGFLFAFFERFLYFFSPKLHREPKYYWLSFIVMTGLILSARGLQIFSAWPAQFKPEFLVALPIAAILLSFLVSANISLLGCTLLSVLVVLMYEGDISLFFYLFMMSAVTTFSVFKRNRRRDIVLAGYVVGVFGSVFVAIIGLMQGQTDLIWYGLNGGGAFANGVISSMIVLALLPYFESLFRITTSQSLMELSSLDHPLLKRLMMRAPGTYQHSLMVGNLAEAGAEAIHANALLCRVGGYYHDIGKIKRPQFYAENQHSSENPHKSLAPRMSKILIASHTKDGAELADKFALPEVIQRFIMTHHGTSIVSFFYKKAVQSEGLEDSDASKDEFRYSGPKPSSKEEGIVMLADSVEATLRSMEKPTIESIEAMIDLIFKEKIEDGQLSDCQLTFKDLQDIRRAFLHMLQSIYHNRLDYQTELNSLMTTSSEEAPDTQKTAKG